ncbi:Holin-like protein CidA, partial [Frankliniella fusca]
QVSWLTSLLHADILSSRFDQQANSPGSWTKLALKPLLLKRIQNASLETCVSWLTSLLHADILTNSPGSWAKLALNHPLLDKRIQNASWETCGFNVQDVSGVTLDNNGGAKKNIRNKTNGPCVEERQPVDPKMPSFPGSILDPLVEQWMVQGQLGPTSGTVGQYISMKKRSQPTDLRRRKS